MKFLRTLVITLIAIFVIFITGTVGVMEGSYYYQVNKLSPVKQLSDVNYPRQLQEVMWVASTETGEIEMDKLSVTSFVYQIFKSFGQEAKGSGLQGSYIAATLADIMLNDNPQADPPGDDRTVQSAILGVWVTKNFTSTEAMNAMIDQIYLGNEISGADNAATLYFDKSVDALGLSENLVLGVLMNWPNLASFCGDNAQLIVQAESLLELLKTNFPANYQGSEFVAPEYSEAATANCN